MALKPMHTFFQPSQVVFFIKKKLCFWQYSTLFDVTHSLFLFPSGGQSIFLATSLTLDSQLAILKCGWLGVLITGVD